MNFPTNQNIICFSPHPDDEAIFAGALLAKLAESNRVHVLYLTNGIRGISRCISDEGKVTLRQAEARDACSVLGCVGDFLNLDKELKASESDIGQMTHVTDRLKGIIKKFGPALVITIYRNDAHHTHRTTALAVEDALRGSKVPLLQGEVWTLIDKPNEAYYFGTEGMDMKKKALCKYASQIERTDWVTAVEHLNRFRAIVLPELLHGFGSAHTPPDIYAETFYYTSVT